MTPATPGLSSQEKRVLNPRPWRHFRKTYSVTEFRLGLGVLGVLAAVAAWVAWRGAHPDPAVLGGAAPLDPGATADRSDAGAAAAGKAQAVSPAGVARPAVADRGPLPERLAMPGWHEGPVSRFDANNLYEKIDGRADYFISRGFQSLTCTTLSNEKSASTIVDVELYDLGSTDNALSAFTGEKPPEIASSEVAGTSWYGARNALFVARGRYYVRAIGSDEGPDVKAALGGLKRRLDNGLKAGERAWADTLLRESLGVPADKITFFEENAFSFGFAKNVHSALMPDGETELFVVQATDEGAAKELAGRFENGFLSYGEKVESGGAAWVKDRYLGSFARAEGVGRVVIGVRGASKLEAAEKELARLRKAVAERTPTAGAAGGGKETKP